MRSVERARNVGPSFRELVHVGLVSLSSARLTFDPHVHVPATNCISLADFIRLIRASRYRNYGRGNASRNPENLCRHPPSPFDVPIFLSLPPFYPLASFFFFFSRVFFVVHGYRPTQISRQSKNYRYNFSIPFLKV